MHTFKRKSFNMPTQKMFQRNLDHCSTAALQHMPPYGASGPSSRCALASPSMLGYVPSSIINRRKAHKRHQTRSQACDVHSSTWYYDWLGWADPIGWAGAPIFSRPPPPQTKDLGGASLLCSFTLFKVRVGMKPVDRKGGRGTVSLVLGAHENFEWRVIALGILGSCPFWHCCCAGSRAGGVPWRHASSCCFGRGEGVEAVSSEH